MKDLIQFQCLVKDPKKCHVTVNKYKARKLPLVHISADEVSFPKNIRIESVLSVKAENAIRVQASIVCPRIKFYTPKGSVIISAEGILRTTVVVSVARKTYVEGLICYQEKIKRKNTQEEVDNKCSLQNTKQGSITEEDTSVSQSTIDDSLKSREIPGSCLRVTIDGDLHIGTDGKIGIERTNNVHEHSVVTQLTLSVSGDIHNFGKVSAALILDIKAQSILTGRQCKEDTVQRYFDRIEERLELFNAETEFECEPTSSSLISAVNACKAPLIPALLRLGADSNAPTGKDRFVPTSIACKKLSEGFVTENYGGYSDKRESPDSVASLLKAWGKRSGMIVAPSINCHMSGDIQDCSQLKGKTVHLMVGGDLVVEEDSIWTSGFVSGLCSGNFIVNGIVKLDKFKTFTICKEFLISEIGKVLTANGGEVLVGERFCNMNRMLNAHEQLDITTTVFEQDANALLGSRAKLKLTIQGNSTQCEGQIKGKRVLFNIAASVESKCDINAEEVCIIEIAEGLETKRFGHFLNKGIINVKDGDLVAVRKIKTRVSDTADITVEGRVISKGVRASSIHIRTMKSSKIEIHPNPNVAAEIPSINCLTGSLTTEPGSLLHLMTDTEHRDVLFHCCDKWNHNGELELIKSVEAEGLYNTSGYFEVFQTYNLGKIENCDTINLLVQEQFNNYTNLSAQKEISITGSGEICNKSNISINCSAGPITMKNIGSLTNEGLVVGVHDVEIKAENISNTYGTIQSCTGSVQLMWTTERYKSVEISGTVLSPVAVAFVVKEAEYFLCQCVGGEVEKVDGFALPKCGLLIECKNSNVIFSTSVLGDADVKVFSKWNMYVLKDMQVRSFEVEATGKDVSRKNKDVLSTIYENSAEHEEETKDTKESNQQQLERDDETIMPIMMIVDNENEQVTKEDSINMNEFEKMLEPSSDSNFCVYIGKESNLSCKKMDFTSEFHTNIRIQTMQDSKVLCEKIFRASSGVIFDCSLQVIHGSSLKAYGVEITKNAELSIAKSDADVESNVDIYFANCFENYGNIYNKDNTLCHLQIWCMEDEYSTMKNNLPTPSEAKLKSSSVLISGTVTISGKLQLVNVDQVQIDKEASVSCEGFLIPETENKSITSLLIERGCLKIQGPCTCFLKKLTIQEHGVFNHISDKDDYGCYIEVSNSASLSGRLEFSLKGTCLLRCKESLICKSLHAEIDSDRFKIIASQSVVIDSDSHMFVKRGNLCITNAEYDDTQVNGEIEICGKIDGEVFPQSGEVLSRKSEPDEIPCGNSECDEIPSRKSSLEIEGCKVFLNGAHLTGFNKTELFAAESMVIDPTSKLKGGHAMEIDIASLEVKGEIKEYEILHFKPRTMLVTGKIHKCSKITIEAEYAAVNCGEIHGKHTGIVAPIYLNCPEFPHGNVQSSINMVPQIGDDEQKELIIEGLLCIVVGSQLQGTNINIKSVLRFEFASKKSTVPSSSDLDNWKNVVNTSLSKMYSSIDPSGVKKLVEQVASIPKVICKLGVASHLCSDIVQMSQNIRNGGLADFNIENLVGSLNKAHEEYSRISSFSIQVNIRPKLRKLKDATARTARFLMNKCFGSSSFGNRLTFKEDSEIEEGTEATSFIFQGENTDIRTTGNYIADSLTFNGGKGSWKNQGHLEACGDIFISAKTVYQKGSRVEQVIAGGSLCVQAQDLEMENIKANKLQAKATKSAKIKSAEISDKSVIDSDKFMVIENVKTKDLHVRGEESASIKSVKAANDVVISGGDIAVDNLEAKLLQTDATKSTLIKSASLTEDALVQGRGNIKVSDVKAENLDVTGESSVDIQKASIDNDLTLKASGDIKANYVNMTNMVIDGKRDIRVEQVIAGGSLHVQAAQDLELENVKAKKLQAKSTRSAKIKAAEISDESVIDSDKCVVIENVKTKDLHVRGEESASIKSVKAANDVVISGGDIAVDNLEAKHLQTDALKSTLIKSASLTEDALIHGRGDIKVSDVKAENLGVTGESSVDIQTASIDNNLNLKASGDIKVNSVNMTNMDIDGKRDITLEQVIAGGSLTVQAAQDLELENIKAKKLQAKGTRSAKIKSAEISDESVIDSDKCVLIENVETKDLHVRGEESASIKSVMAANDVVISGGDIAVDDLEAKHLQTDASKSTLNELAYLTEDALIQGRGDIKVSDVKAQNLGVTGESSADIKKASIDNDLTLKASGYIETSSVNTTNMVIDGKRDISIGDVKAKGSVQLKSAKGRISLDSKIKANTLSLDANNVSLTGKAGKADHQLKTLSVKTQQIQNIERLLNRSGVYKDMQISDQLDLAVEDQNVVLANIRKLDFDLSLRAASIDVVSNVRSDHDVQLQAKKQDITLHQGSSVSSRKKVYMESEKGSVNITAARVHGEHSVTIKAEKDVNIMAVGGNQSAQKSTVSAGTGDYESGSPAIAIKAGRDIKVHASEVTSEGTNQFIAGRDIELTAHTYQTVHRERESSWLGLIQQTTTTTTTHVDKSNIRGKNNVFKAGGEFTSIATNIQSEDGNLIHAKGNVSFKDIVATQTVNTSTKVLGGILYSKDENETTERSYGTLVEDSSALANTKIISDTSNIEWIGSSMKTPGNFTETAHRGKVIHSQRILTKTYQTTESGYYFSNPNTGKGVGFGYKFQHTDGRSQSTSDDSVQVGGNYSIEAKEFEALNSFSFMVNGDMTVDARKITFAGAELKSLEDSGGFGIGLSDTAIEATVNFSHQYGTQQQSQNLYTGGTFRMVNVEDASFINSKANVGAMTGDVKNMNVISRADSAFKVKTEIGIGFDLVTETPTASLNIDTGISNVVKQQASINVRSDSNGLSVKTLTLTGAEITFDGDVHDFADNIVCHDVHEIDNEFGLGFDISKKVPTGKSAKKFSLAMHHSQGRLRSCVMSKNGEVHQSIRQKVNTDMDKCRVVDTKFGYAITHKGKGNLSKNTRAIGKSIAKSVGKDALKACGTRLVSELGLPDDIANAIVDIASGNAPLRETLIFIAGKACMPKDLIDAIEDFILKKDPTKLLIWICRKSGIDNGIVCIIIDVVQKGKFDQESFLRIAKHVCKLLNLSEDIVIILEQLVRGKQRGVSTTLTIQTVTMGLIKSPDGQWITKKLCNITKIPDDIANLIVAFFKQTTLAEKGIIILKAVGVQLNLPEKLLEGLREAVLHHKFKSLLQWVCKEIGMDQHLVLVVVDSIRNKKNKGLKEILHLATRCIAKYFGISDNVITDVETGVDGKQPKDGILMLILNILDDLSKSKQFLAARKMLFEKLETFCQDLKIPKNILKTVSDLSQQIAAGKRPTFAIPLVLYLLESFGVAMDLIDGIRSLLQNRDPSHLANWLAVKLGFDPKLFSLLAKGVVEEKSMKQIIITAIKYYCIKYNMPAKLTDDIIKIIDEDLPKCYGILKDNLSQKTQSHFQKQFDVGREESKRISKEKHHQTKHGMTCTLEHHKHQFCDQVQGRPVKNIEGQGHQNTEHTPSTASVGNGHEQFSLDDTNKNQEGQGSAKSMSKGSFKTNESKQSKCLNCTKQVGDAIRCDLGEILTNIAEDSKMKKLFEEYGEIIQETNEGRILFKALCALDGTEESLIKLLYPLAEEIGIPETIVSGISDLVMQEDPTSLAIWLGGVASIESDLIVAFFKVFRQNELKEIVHIVMKGACLVFGLSKTTIKTIDKIFRKDLKADEMKDHFVKIAFETITPKVQKLAVSAGIPDFLMELLFSIVDIEKPMDLQTLLRKLLEHLVSMFNIPSDVFNQISKGQYKQAVVQLVLFLLQRIMLPKTIIDIVDGLFNKDITALVRWLSRRFGIDQQILTKLARDIENGAPFIAIIKGCMQIVCMKLKLPSVVITDIELILDEKPPENALKAYEEFLKGNYDVISKEAALCKCKELNLPLIFIDYVETVFKENSSCDKAINLFVIFASVCGVPEDFSIAIADVFFRKDKTKIFVWIEKETGVKPVLSEAIVDTILSPELDVSSGRRLLKGGCLSVGLSNTTSDRVQAIFDSDMPKKDTKILVIDIAIEISLPHISKAIEQWFGVPSDIVANLLRILRLDTTFEQCSKLIETLALKLGMPEDLVKAIHALVCDQNNCLIAVWISNKIGIHKGLVLSVLDTLRSSQSLLDAVKKLPACFFKYLGLSNEVINTIEKLMDNKLSASEIPKLLTLVTAELFKTKVDKDIVAMVTYVITTEDWFDRVMHFVRYIANTYNIPIECVDGVGDLIKKKDPTKIAMWLADKIGVNQTVMVTLAKAVLQRKDPKQIMSGIAKAAGIPEEAVLVLEEMIKHNTGKLSKKGAITGSHSGTRIK